MKFSTYALSAPPPFACPSNFVTITEATSTLSLNALALNRKWTVSSNLLTDKVTCLLWVISCETQWANGPTLIKDKLLLSGYEQLRVVQYGEIGIREVVGAKVCQTRNSRNIIHRFSWWQHGRISVLITNLRFTSLSYCGIHHKNYIVGILKKEMNSVLSTDISNKWGHMSIFSFDQLY